MNEANQNVSNTDVHDFWGEVRKEIEAKSNLTPMQEIALVFVGFLNSLPNFNREMVFQVVEHIQDDFLTPVAHLIYDKIKDNIHPEQQQNILNCVLEITNIFDPVSTEYKFLKILKERKLFKDPSMNIIELDLEPQPSDVDAEVRLKEVRRGGVYLGISDLFLKLFSIEQNLKAMIDHINAINSSPAEINDNFLKGKFWRNKIKRYRGKICIPYMLYSDGFEVNNPLGSKAGKQGLNGYYLSFPSVPRHVSGLIENIFLIMFGYCSVEKTASNEEILGQLIEEIIEMEQNGLELELDGKKQKVFFLFGGLRGDNLGLNKILDYSASFVAKYPCRTCLMDLELMRKSVLDHPSYYRTEANYNEALKNGFALSGVHRDSPFNTIPDFHITELKHVDIMHDFYEGYAHDSLTSCLDRFFEQGYITLEQLNNRIKRFDYEYNDRRNKPEPITMDHINARKLKTSSGQMRSLIENLPLMIGELIPDCREWDFLISVVKIGDQIMSPFFTVQSLEEVRQNIANNLTEYMALFETHLKPKGHFLTHYKESIENFGPARFAACYIPEARHRIYKKIAKFTESRQNIALTISIKDRLMLAYNLMIQKNYFNPNLFIPGKARICPVSV